MNTFTRYRATTYHPNPVISTAYQKTEAQRMRKSLSHVHSENRFTVHSQVQSEAEIKFPDAAVLPVLCSTFGHSPEAVTGQGVSYQVFRLHRSPVYKSWREKLLPSQIWGGSRQGRFTKAAKQKASVSSPPRGVPAESTRGICHTCLPSPQTAKTLSSERRSLRTSRLFSSASAPHCVGLGQRPSTRPRTSHARPRSSYGYVAISPEEVKEMDDLTVSAMLESKQQAIREMELKLDRTRYEVQVLSLRQQEARSDLSATAPEKAMMDLPRPYTAPYGDLMREFSPRNRGEAEYDGRPLYTGTICV
ncbi:hypothetical protein FOZ60_006731 [Perkinsus olseni]|uniref:Uncharacterized protein n=1 Tax=Perkinsus olseni TaxID=32597 RepID=A0A7J6PFB4_PEROL|nr:hypothetical protein FOZ60_006731 [Perkinsus olseni]